MNVFLSWSGNRSKEVALFLKEWLSCVIQSIHPWVSSKDIDRGSLWFSEISQQLSETSVGIICLTQENKEKPWILFEAGALAKGLHSSRVCTFLIDLEPKDVGDPLAQFNHTLPEKESILDLVSTLNSAGEQKLLDDAVLSRVFETYWAQFEDGFRKIIDSTKPSPAKPRPQADILSEILDTTRSLSQRIRRIEDQAAQVQSLGGRADSRFDGDQLLGLAERKLAVDSDQIAKIVAESTRSLKKARDRLDASGALKKPPQFVLKRPPSKD